MHGPHNMGAWLTVMLENAADRCPPRCELLPALAERAGTLLDGRLLCLSLEPYARRGSFRSHATLGKTSPRLNNHSWPAAFIFPVNQVTEI